MSQLQTSLNKLRIISETFNSIPLFAGYNWNDNKKVYNTKLSQLAFEFDSGLTPISNSKRERILSKWNLLLDNKIDKSELTIKDFEILSFESNVILKPIFWDILMDIEETTPKIIIGLLYSVHKMWLSIENLESVLNVLRVLIYNFKGKNKIINFWKNNLKYVLAQDSPTLLAKDSLNANGSINYLSKKYFINLENTELGQIVQEKIVEEKILMFTNNKSLSLNKVQNLINEINSASFYKKESNFYYALIILGVDVSQKDKNAAKDFLKDYFINHIDYKDPRKNLEKWLSFNEEARSVFISWLNEQDIRVFFDVFIDYDPHGRKHFWLNYSRNVKNTQIIQAPSLSQNIKNEEKINELKKKGYIFPKLIDAQTNAFILDFDEFTVVEFSENGNACYIYEKDKMQVLQKTKNSFYIGELKNKNKALNVITHNKNWQYNLTNWLAHRGIRP